MMLKCTVLKQWLTEDLSEKDIVESAQAGVIHNGFINKGNQMIFEQSR